LELHWYKHAAGHWCLLDDVDPTALETGYGVFVIWRQGAAAKVSAVLYVGRGRLKSELAEIISSATPLPVNLPLTA
jgi:hypothetical protein